MRFKKDERIPLENGEMIVLAELGEGGQGEVYMVSYNKNSYAFKYYKEITSEDFKINLANNINRGRPSKDFLWPLKLIELSDKHIGYLMELRPNDYVSFISYLNGKNSFKDLTTMISFCIELCISFKSLHEMGFSYQDLNDGSFFFKPETGDLLICDNDNVTADKKNLGILGKMRYMAPEIVRGDKLKDGSIQMPDIHSDRFSLAIILFMTLCLANPFEGERLKKYDVVDEKCEYEMYGADPVFIYHKTNSSNRPIRGYHTSVLKRWPYLPSYIKEAFHRTFVDGLIDRENERTTELEWIKLLTMYRDELISCSCGHEFIWGFKENKQNLLCPYCNKPRKEVAVLTMNKRRIILEPGKRLYAYHVDKYSSSYNEVCGEVIQNKNNPAIWGIKMNVDGKIQLKDSKGNVKEINGNGVIPIIKDLKLRFENDTIGEIK